MSPLRDQRTTLDLPWLGPALVLSVPTLWYLAPVFSPDPSQFAEICLALSGPLWLLVPVALFELFARLSSGKTPACHQVSIGPLGRIDLSYVYVDNPGRDLRRGVISVSAMLVVSGILLLPSLLISSHNSPELLWMPGLAIGGYAVIQLLPSLPGAGGYATRDIFWFLHSDALSGSRAAFLYSQIVASALVLPGIYLLIFESQLLIVAIWCLFLAIYVVRCARLEILRTTLINRSANVIAADALSGLNPTVRAAASIPDALDILLEQRANGPALVRNRNQYAGMLDLSSIDAVPRSDWPELTASDLVVPFHMLVESNPGATLLNVLQIRQANPHSIVIVRERDGRIVGLVDETMDARALLRRGLSRTIPGPVRRRGSGGS